MYAGRPELEAHEIRFVEETLRGKVGKDTKLGIYFKSAVFSGRGLKIPKPLIERFLEIHAGKLSSIKYPRGVIEKSEYGFVIRPPGREEETKTLPPGGNLEFPKGSEIGEMKTLRGAWAIDHLGRLHFVDISKVPSPP